MKDLRTLAPGLLGLALLTTTPLCTAQTTANGPYYATPSWDQTMPTASRFVVLANFNSEAVLDRETGLVWERTPQTQALSYANAASACIGQSTGARYGWRLPSINELTSLFDTSLQKQPFLPAGHPFNVTSDYFWSSSSAPTTSIYVTGSGGAPARYITSGFSVAPGVSLFRAFPKTEDADNASGAPAWCVRGPGAAVANGG